MLFGFLTSIPLNTVLLTRALLVETSTGTHIVTFHRVDKEP